ncbi:MAG: OmpA family protein [Deltaproteobacteria bacterium]|nr:OmpA family protein [Deltaproteobacteria bacterium]
MKPSCVALLIVTAAVATADADVELGVMGGVHLFNQNSELGVYDRPDATSQRNSVLAGLRLGVFALDVVGIEAEVGVIPTKARETGFGVIDLTYRAHLIVQARARKPDNKIIPFLLVGAGGFSVVKSNNVHYRNDMARTITSDTDAAYYFGGGAKLRAGAWWGIRADVRVLAMPSSENTLPPDPEIKKTTADFEAMVSIYADLGGGPHSPRHAPPPPLDADGDRDAVLGAADRCPTDPEDKDGHEDADGCPDADNDADGIVDGEDRCALEAEDRDGFEDTDGCPDRDNDGDGIADHVDRCPAEAEDVDGFQDDDGCVEADNDGDGVTDGLDQCGAAPETVNGYRDDDGCADTVPAAVVKLTTGTAKINFRVASLQLSPRSRTALNATVRMLTANPDVRLEVRVHTDGKNDQQLAGRRAMAVVAYLVKRGIAPARLTGRGYGDSRPRRVELRLLGTP